MRCWQCDATVRSGAKLCVYCGANLETDTDRADAGVQDRYSRDERPSRSGSNRRSSRQSEWDESDAEDDFRRPNSSGRRLRDVDQESYSRGRDQDRGRDQGGDDTGYQPRDSYRRGGRSERDPLADPRAPQSVRSLPLRDAGPSRRGSQPRNERWSPSERPRREESYDSYRERPSSRSRPDRYDDNNRSDRHDNNDRYEDNGWDRRGRGSSRSASSDYSDEYPAQGWRDEKWSPAASGRLWQDEDQGRPSRSAYAEPARDDSWNMPAAAGWTDESAQVPAPPSRRGAKSGHKKADKRRPDKQTGKRSRLMSFLVSSLVVGVLAAAGLLLAPMILGHLHHSAANTCGGSSQAGAPGPTPTLPSNYKLYTDKQAGYSIPYPTSWSSTSGTDTSQAQSDDVTRFTQSSPNAVFTIEHTPAFNCETNAEIIQSEVLGGQQAGETFTEIPSTGGAQAVSGEQCVRKEFTVTPQSKSGLHMAIIGCHHAGRGYAFVVFSDASAFTQTYSSVFQTMLSDFRFSS